MRVRELEAGTVNRKGQLAPLSFFLSLSLLSLCPFLSLSLSLSLPLIVSLSLSLSLARPLLLSLSLSLSLFLSLTLTHSLTHHLSLSRSLSPSIYLSHSISLSVCLSLSLSLSLTVSLPPPLSLSLSLSLSLPLSLCLGTVEVWYRGGRGCGIGCRHLRGGRACLPDRCRAPQRGWTPLHFAAMFGHATVAGQLLAAGADVEAKDTVMGGGTRVGRGRGATRTSSCHFCLGSFEKSSETASP